VPEKSPEHISQDISYSTYCLHHFSRHVHLLKSLASLLFITPNIFAAPYTFTCLFAVEKGRQNFHLCPLFLSGSFPKWMDFLKTSVEAKWKRSMKFIFGWVTAHTSMSGGEGAEFAYQLIFREGKCTPSPPPLAPFNILSKSNQIKSRNCA